MAGSSRLTFRFFILTIMLTGMTLLTGMLTTDTRAGERQADPDGIAVVRAVFIPLVNRGEFQGCVEITEETTWTLSGSPYLVSCDVYVAPEVMLTIEAGVTVQFEHPEDELLIAGLLQAVGTQEAPITFEPISGTVSGSWGRVLFYEGSTGLLDHTVLEYGGSYRGMLYIASDAVQVLNSVVQYGADTGIYIQAASPLISATQILSNTSSEHGGGLTINAGSPTIENNLISGNSISTTMNLSYGGGIHIYSGFALIQNNTIIGNHATEGGGIRTYDSGATIQYNTITGNTAYHGGGLWNAFSNPVIEHNTIVSNTAVYYGGGLFNTYNGSPYIGNNTFISNTAGSGGGIYIDNGAPSIFTNTISGNAADYSGGGLFNQSGLPDILGNTLTGNRADLSGGGIYIFSEGHIIQHNTFTQNSAQTEGGGLYINSAAVYLWDNTFMENSAEAGGGVFILNDSPIVRNNIFAGNHAVDGGGLRMGTHGVGGHIEVNVFFGNTGDSHGGGMYLECVSPDFDPAIQSNIVISNTSADGGGIWISGEYFHLDYNDVWGNTGGDYSGLVPGAHDISADPRLVDPTTGDFHLAADSPCIDKAHPSEYPPTDFEGEVRPNGPAPDIGPDEYYARMD